MKLYAISGLGADQRVFQYLTLDCELIPIDWIKPQRKESIESYAHRLSKAINTKEPFGVLGVSFGGLVAVEISKILQPAFTILISTVAVKSELRTLHRFISKTKLITFTPTLFFDIPRSIAGFLFGTKNTKLLNAILDDTDPTFVKWALQQLTSWQNEESIENCLRIHGTKDKMIPFPKNSNVQLIEGGEHFMIVDCAEEISEIINDFDRPLGLLDC